MWVIVHLQIKIHEYFHGEVLSLIVDKDGTLIFVDRNASKVTF